MKRLLAVVLLLSGLALAQRPASPFAAFLPGGPQSQTVIQFQQAGSNTYLGVGYFKLNFASGCTVTNVSGAATVNCSGGSAIPCTTTALSLQFNNAGSFGCAADFTFSGHSVLGGASSVLDLHSAGTGGLLLPGAFASGLVTVTTSTGALSVTAPPVNTTATGSNWLTAYNSTTGVFTKAQPACGDLSNGTASCSTDTTNATNITSGTLATGRMAAISLTGSGNGGVQANQGTTTTVLHGNAAGQPSFGSIVLSDFAVQTANTILGNYTAGSATPTAGAAPSGGTNGCSGAADTVTYTTSSGWGCHQISGSGTVNSGTINHLAVYASSTNAVSNDSTLTDDGTTMTYSGTGGVSSPKIQTTSASLSGYDALGGNTANNSVIANTAGWMGPPSASFTAWACQLPATAPSGNQFLQCGTPTSGISTGTWVTLSGSGTVTVVASGSLTSTALVTGGGTTTLQTPSTTSTLDSSGNLAVAAGGSLGSADTGTPKFTFSANKVSLNQPITHAVTSNQEIYGTSTNLTTVNFPASSGGVTLTMPNTTTNVIGANSDTTTTHVMHASATGGIGNFSALAAADMPVVNTVVDTSSPVTVSTTQSAEFHFNENATAGTAMTYNLPTAAAGKQFCISNANNGTNPNTGVITIATSASGQFITFTDGTQSATGGNVTSGGAASDAACVVGIDSTHWQLYVQRGTWTKH